jgi:alpha-ketoglutarate-dependent taurine dioxygenase
MKVRPIHPRFGVEVTGVDLRELSEETRFPDIRALFEKHSLLLFKGQSLDEDAHGAFARLFGPLEDRDADVAGTAPRDQPQALKDRAEETVFLHSVLPSRIETDPRLAELPTVNRYQGQAWRAVWPNPVTGEKALYIANHIYGARGMDWTDARAFAEELIAFATRPEYVYAHAWEPGDVLVWDERATMHRVRPWPFEEVRTLASTCVSARERDGLALVTPADGPIRPEEIFQAPGGSSA